MTKKVYVKNQFNLNYHYIGLEKLLEQNNHKIVYLSTSHLNRILKSLLTLDYKLFLMQLSSIYYHLRLFLSKDEKIVLGVKPYSYRLFILFVLFNRNKMYYHTSYSNWHKKKDFKSLKIKFWNFMLTKKFVHIFSVTKHTKNQLIKYFNVNQSNISVVYHSIDQNFYKGSKKQTEFDFIFSGRLTNSKGIIELINFFKSKNSWNLSIVGKGDLSSFVTTSAKKYENIQYHGFKKNKSDLRELYLKSSFIILPSKKQSDWEELFGISLIEAMYCGLIPISSNHIGPKEIINHGKDGFLLNEENFFEQMVTIFKNVNKEELQKIKNSAYYKSMKFLPQNISKNWNEILI